MNMKKYDHVFSIAFSVQSDNDGENSDEILEACGLPHDTIEN